MFTILFNTVGYCQFDNDITALSKYIQMGNFEYDIKYFKLYIYI